MSEGYRHVVDLDISKFFDTVDHDILMGLIDKHMEDKDIRRLIFVFLKSGVMTNGSMMATALGSDEFLALWADGCFDDHPLAFGKVGVVVL